MCGARSSQFVVLFRGRAGGRFNGTSRYPLPYLISFKLLIVNELIDWHAAKFLLSLDLNANSSWETTYRHIVAFWHRLPARDDVFCVPFLLFIVRQEMEIICSENSGQLPWIQPPKIGANSFFPGAATPHAGLQEGTELA